MRQKPSRQTRCWQSDEEYLADQNSDSSWSHASPWGDSAAGKFVKFGDWLDSEDRLCHDDTVADFGGNDGYASYKFYLSHKIRPLVVDCEPKRLYYAEKAFKLQTLRTFIESMPLKDDQIDWGFCSHTLEHMRDPPRALREMSRVVKRGCYFVLPLESLAHARKNPAHAVCYPRAAGWRSLLEGNGWNVVIGRKVSNHEAHFYAEPK